MPKTIFPEMVDKRPSPVVTETKIEVLEPIFREMVDKWQSPVVPRTEIGPFSGRMMSEKYLANLDCAGKGPEGSFYCGRKRCYPTINTAVWLQSRCTAVIKRHRTA